MISLLNSIKIYQLVQKLLGGNGHRQDFDPTILNFSFRKESRVKTESLLSDAYSRFASGGDDLYTCRVAANIV
jgi:hypothetical protein